MADPKTLTEIVADIVAAAADPRIEPPEDLLAASRAAIKSCSDVLQAYRINALSLFVEAAGVMQERGTDRNVAHRLLANELLYNAAFTLQALKRRLGEPPSPARFAIVAYAIADSAPFKDWEDSEALLEIINAEPPEDGAPPSPTASHLTAEAIQEGGQP